MSILYKSLQANQLFIRSSLPIVYFLIFLSICFLSFRLPLLVIPSLFSTDGCFTKFTSYLQLLHGTLLFVSRGRAGGRGAWDGKKRDKQNSTNRLPGPSVSKIGKMLLVQKYDFWKWMNGGIWHCIWITFHLLTQLRSQTQVCVPLVGRNKQ